MLKKIIKKTFHSLGYDIVKHGTLSDRMAVSMDSALLRCRTRGVEARTVFDVGASDGRWSDVCMRHFAPAEYVLIEAQSIHERSLARFCEKHSNCRAVMAAAGREVGNCYFDNSDPFGGAVIDGPLERGMVSVPVTTIDFTRESMKLRPPYIIKLDTHGYELPILEGASRTLSDASLLII